MNFVGRPPVRYQNRQYAALMVHYYAVYLFVTLPVKEGGLRNAQDRLTPATDLGRTYVACHRKE